MKAIALFSDMHMLPGLHVTLLTLLDSLECEEGRNIVLYLFLDKINSEEKELLSITQEKNAKGSKLVLHDFSPAAPLGGNSLHGNNTAYGRLYLPELLSDHDKCIYLDCDLIINRSIHGLFDEFDDASVLIVDGDGVRKHSLDKDLFIAANLDLDGPCFNSGVMGINLSLWRERYF